MLEQTTVRHPPLTSVAPTIALAVAVSFATAVFSQNDPPAEWTPTLVAPPG